MTPFRRLSGLAVVVTVATAILTQPPVARAQQTCGSWTQVAPPAGETSAVTNVTARSPDDAWALSVTLGIIHWDGMAWSAAALPDLSGLGNGVGLRGLTVLPSGHVFAAGVVSTGPFSSDQVLLGWDGFAWDVIETLTLTPNLAGAPRGGAPRDVDGADPNDLWIVGTASGFGDGVSGPPVLTVHWDGSQLTEFITPGLGVRQNHLYGVVAVATDDVWAVGYYNNVLPNGIFHAMVLHWDGASWHDVPNPAQGMDQTFLYDVAAVGPNDVWAAGKSLNGPLFMHWDGTEWAIVPGPAGATGTIQKLAAIAPDDVWAVDSPWAVPLISKYYHWDGNAWSVVAPPEIPGATTVSRHGGLAAAGTCDVWAVGSATTDGIFGPFIERLRPGSGTVSTPPLSATAAIMEAYPNPMRRSTEIRLQIPGGGIHRVQVYDLGGRLVRTLLERSPLRTHRLSWNARDTQGRLVPGGIYYLRAYWGEGRVLLRKLTVVP